MTMQSQKKVAAIQMVSGCKLEENLKQAESLIQSVCQREGPELVVLPENFALFESQALFNVGKQEATGNNVIRKAVTDWARTYQVDIVAGSIPMAVRPDGMMVDGNKVRSACITIDRSGHEVARYDKVHLFDVDVDDKQQSYRESAYMEAGDRLAVYDSPVGKVGFSICYDLRFPYLYTSLRNMGAEVLTVPAAFTYKTGEAHWEILLRSRAIENQCYVIASNQGGRHSRSRETWGHSMIISPWGEVLSCLESGAGYVTAVIDQEIIKDVRHRMPLMSHQKLI